MKTNVLILSLVLLLNFEGLANGSELDLYGGFTKVVGQKTGYFHTEKIDGRWWMVTPEGHGFFGIGISHPVTHFSQGVVTFGYKGSQEAWLRDGVRKLRELGYNCAWSGPYSTERNFMGFANLELARRVYLEEKFPHALHIPLIKLPVERPIGVKRPDVFSDEYRQYVEEEVAKLVPEYKDEPLLIGYYFGFGCFLNLYDLLGDRISGDPDYIGVSFCACLFDNSNAVKPYERGQPGFFTIDAVPRRDLWETANTVNKRMLKKVHEPLSREMLDHMDEEIDSTREAYSVVMAKRRTYLQKLSAPEKK